MDYYEGLPIYKSTMDTFVSVARITRGFSKRHKYTLGVQLKARVMDMLERTGMGSIVESWMAKFAVLMLAVAGPMAGARSSLADAPPERYETTAETVRDTRTELMWQRRLEKESEEPDAEFVLYTQAAAIRYCDENSLAGFTDWRLPQRGELLTLVDPTRANPAIDTSAFPENPSPAFWTSSAFVGSSGNAWFVDFGNGGSGGNSTDNTYRVRCVR